MKTLIKKQTAIEKLIEKYVSNFAKDHSFYENFKQIILDKVEGYGKDKAALKSFFEDLQHGGCQSGIIGDFIYNSDCKAFYIKHIDDLENFKAEQEDSLGEPIQNKQQSPHYTFMCWLCFEEFCYQLYSTIFEQ
jgi:hypothetical protein